MTDGCEVRLRRTVMMGILEELVWPGESEQELDGASKEDQ